jgi:hypothetical protein
MTCCQPLQDIEQELLDSISAVQLYQQRHPHVFNLNKLTRRIKSDLMYIRQLAIQPAQQLTESRLQVGMLTGVAQQSCQALIWRHLPTCTCMAVAAQCRLKRSSRQVCCPHDKGACLQHSALNVPAACVCCRAA